MKLHYAPGTISIAAAIALEEAGLDYTAHKLDFSQGDQNSTAYLAINPKGRVPALDVDGQILTETGAILDFVAAHDPRLMPADLVHAAHARSVMYYLASTMHVNHAHKMRGHRWADNAASHADMTAKVPETMTASATFVEAGCIRGTYVLGDHFSIADCYLFVVCNWLPGDGVDLAPFPKIRAFMDAMEARHSVQTVRANGMLP
ncbi:glutathione S-transferase family protein [uncultured Tateyamaria sp.]|uniref:glutathione S-transferase family protein n=1 Tax=uncultured Tateyamaria sp. TaxID=455651 RepID=UPI00263373B6|nr:glutathione S-transferase family protein [uncultured Tateyamaria sp.]